MSRRALLLTCVLAALGCGRTTVGDFDAGSPTLEPTGGQKTDLLRRWNLAVDSFGDVHSRDFHWLSYDDFPHPTYRQGDATAYEEFSQVLLRFYQSGDNAEFLRRNLLQHTPFGMGPAASRQETSFCELTLVMAQSPLVSSGLQESLKPFGDFLGC